MQGFFPIAPCGPPSYIPTNPSTTFNTTFCRLIRIATTSGMNRSHQFPAGPVCVRDTLLVNPCERFFSATVTPADPWSFKLGMAVSAVTALFVMAALIRLLLEWRRNRKQWPRY